LLILVSLVNYKLLVKYFNNVINKLFADITEVPVILQDNYYPALTGLRGVAILMVLLHHFGVDNYTLPYGVFIDSNAGVHIFFVLSGFLITTLLLKEKLANGRIRLSDFYIRRALRILPVAYLFLLILMVLNHYYHLHIPRADFIASLLFYKNLPMLNEPYTAHFWSLAVEEQFYLTFPLLLALNTNRYMVVAISITVIVPVVCILNHFQFGPLIYTSAGQFISKICMYAFWKGPVIILVGSVFSLLLFKGIIRPERFAPNYFLSFILLVGAVVFTNKYFLLYSKYTSEYMSAFLTAFTIMLMLSKRDFLSTLLTSTFLLRMGVLSYSIYIWQELFIGYKPWQPWLYYFAGQPVWILIIFKIFLIMCIATASWYFESIFLNIKSRYKYGKL